MKNVDLTVQGWKDYELIDSGDNRKLERYGKYILIRPETQALWKPLQPALWKEAYAEFLWADGKGAWLTKKNMSASWEITWDDIRFEARLTSFKHTGVFPEQAVNWEWIVERVETLATDAPPRVLNLFGYTGIASIVAAKHGAQVTHLDASKQSNVWAKTNAVLSNIPSENIRYLLDDALKFIERDVRRGAEYDGIIVDPPAFGRGANGEVWKIEESLQKLLSGINTLLSKKSGAFFLLNGYAAGYSPQSLLQAAESALPEILAHGNKINIEYGELRIKESTSERVVPSGIYVRTVRQ